MLLACDLSSSANVTAAGGVVNGTATFAGGGMIPGSAGSVSFTAFAGMSQLQYEGQIVVTVSTTHVCKPDDAASVSGSVGENKAANNYLWAVQDSVPTSHAYLLISTAEALVGKLHASDTQSSALSLSSVGKSDRIEICVSWKGTEGEILVNGGRFQTFTRANFGNVFNKLVVGAAFNGTSTPNANATFYSVVVSRRAVRFVERPERVSIGIFGDSYVTNANSAGGAPRYDNRATALFNRYLSESGWKCNRFSWRGFGGYYVGDVGGGTDLSAQIDTFVADQTQVAVIIAGNNDSTNATARLTTEANYKTFIQKIAGETAVGGRNYRHCRKIIVCTPGSMRQDSSLDTADNNAGRKAVHDIVMSLPSWWDTTYPARAGLVEVVDLYGILGGDRDGNLNYWGALNALGNISSGGSASPVSPNDRHPSGLGNYTLFRAIAKKL